MKVVSAFKMFQDDRAVYVSPETLETYKSHFSVYWQYLKHEFKVPVEEIDFMDIPPSVNIYSGYVIYLRTERTVKNVTIHSYCRPVKAFLRFCYENDLCKNYVKGVKLPRDDSAPKMPLYASEVEAIDRTFKDDLQGKRNYAVLHLMLDCGLRSQEVRHLKFEDIDKQHNLIHINDSKGCKSRIVLCPDLVINAVDSYSDISGRSSGIVFQSLKADVPLTKSAITQFFADIKKASGVQRLHPHLLRHTFATSYLLGGGNLEFLRVFMGHYDYSVTKMYSSLAAQCKMLGIEIYKLDKIFFERGY